MIEQDSGGNPEKQFDIGRMVIKHEQPEKDNRG